MMPLPRLLSCLVIACVLSAPAIFVTPAQAQQQQDAAAADPDQQLLRAVENFWHYGKIARYDLAAPEAQVILQRGEQDPGAVLRAFETVARRRNDDLDLWLGRFQRVPQLKEVAEGVIQTINRGHEERRADPEQIRRNIETLSEGERAYRVAIARLRQSGELAVPFMLDYLSDSRRSQFHAAIRRGLRDLGRESLNPLVAATELENENVLVAVVSTLGDLGYTDVAPYIARLAAHPQAPASVKQAADRSLQQLNVSGNPADLFYELAEKFYYDRAAVIADPRREQMPIWYATANGLQPTYVPTAIFSELMAMRAAEYSMRLTEQTRADALSLWLAANYRREAELPQGAVDATRMQNQPPAHYYGVSAGAQYLNNALARALRDRNSQVALRVIRSLQEIVGQSNAFSGDGAAPLIDAMNYPDRLVRFEAAFALAEALPQQQFQGQERVVPLLGEALAQTGQPSVLVIMPSQDQANAIVDNLRRDNAYQAAGTTTAEAAVATAQQLPAIDVIVISEELGAGQVDQLFGLIDRNARLQGAAKLVITATTASPYEARKQRDPLLHTTQATDPNQLRSAIDQARQAAAALPLDAPAATNYALRAGELLQRLAISRGQVMDVSAAKNQILQALNDARPEIVILAGNVLALISVEEAQPGLLQRAQDQQLPDDVRVSLYKSLATHAKFFGNQLDNTQLQALQQTVEQATNLDVRSAAAEARGALNLPADQAKQLIVKQSRV